MEDSVTVDDRLSKYRQHVDDSIDNTHKERQDAERNRDYVDGEQWTAAEIATLNARGQPVITDNKIKDKIEYMEGVEKKTRTDPKAYPRTQAHEQDADVATDCIRYVFDKNNVNQTKSRVFQNLLVEGMGGAEVIVDRKDPRKILVRYCRWDRLYTDPYSMEPDYSDAMYVGLITWMDVSKAQERWPDAKELIAESMKFTRSSGETHDDKPRWADTKRNRVQVFEHYTREKGTVMRSVFAWGGFLEEPKECPYVNDEGEHEWPLILQSAYIDREGRRYGMVSRYISLQDEVNKRKSKSLHLLNSAQVRAEKGAVEDVAKARQEVHKPDGYVEVTPGMHFEVDRNLDLSQAHFMMLQQAEAALSATGPNAALLGQSGAISGRAKELDQQGGVLQIGVLFDAIRFWQLRVARAVWSRVRQYWDQEMYIRVTDDESGLRFVAINQPVLQGDLMAEELKSQPIPEEQKLAQIRQIAQDPQSQTPVTNDDGTPQMRNQVAQMDMDIIIDEAPDVITIQQEEFAKIAELASSGAVQIPPDVLIEASQLRSQTKKRIMDKLSGANDPAAQMQAQFQQMMQQLQGMLMEAQVRKENASAAKDEAAAQESQIDAAVKVAEFTTPEATTAPETQVRVS